VSEEEETACRCRGRRRLDEDERDSETDSSSWRSGIHSHNSDEPSDAKQQPRLVTASSGIKYSSVLSLSHALCFRTSSSSSPQEPGPEISVLSGSLFFFSFFPSFVRESVRPVQFRLARPRRQAPVRNHQISSSSPRGAQRFWR
jgi:hypothetical protein